jgi:23S rRNA-/tRNA-specific pseudouridylate synthase
VKLAPDERLPGRMRWTKNGKKSYTQFRVRERFAGAALLECRPFTGRTHQLRVHLKAAGYPIWGDDFYGDGQRLYLSRLKRDFRPKPGQAERPLTPTLALHAWQIEVQHPVTGAPVQIEAPWPRELEVALKQLRRYAGSQPSPGAPPVLASSG